ncbi:hypothetical protein HN283_13650 [Acinetobacter baumannii]|uniref:hypothetical protein n=1 Tax=Acinetobacter baumannii TaxID=470 RepID=UPI001896AF0D|nr:hypothetical protein [Acinetobacter baumannii]MBF6813567.1 hypothetical protein [Acinetobacter baumannii]MBF6914119.1 hypothetical protein [Acinetobacter baumannii]MBF6974624.1 hypothetical protein [Acinetobacter baumannii]MCJ9258841.1 ATP-binding protein [Acinetobacter baumannii]
MFGLCGSHRTGKTALAQAYAEKHGAIFLKSDITGWQREIGFDSSNQTYSFDDRMKIQEHMIARLEDLYVEHFMGESKLEPVITDRTPIDLMMYTLAAVTDGLSDEQSQRLEAYLNKCFEVQNKYFTGVMLVQPGIPLVEKEGSAKCCKAFIEKLNTIVLGLFMDGRLRVPHWYLKRDVLDLNKRISLCHSCWHKARISLIAKLDAKETVSSKPDSMNGIEFATETRQ